MASFHPGSECGGTLQKLVCLDRHLHALTRMACFGFKSLCTTDEATATGVMRVQFHWFPRGRHRPLDVLGDLDSAELRDLEREGDFEVRRPSGVSIETTNVFTICAENPTDLRPVDLAMEPYRSGVHGRIWRNAAQDDNCDDVEDDTKHDQ